MPDIKQQIEFVDSIPENQVAEITYEDGSTEYVSILDPRIKNYV